MRLIEIEQTEEAIRAWLKKHNIHKYAIESDGSVNVFQNVKIHNDDTFEHLPVQFGTVQGSFQVISCDAMIDLTNFPTIVENYFFIYGNDSLRSLIGSPVIVRGRYICSYNPALVTLHGIEKLQTQTIDCSHCHNLVELAMMENENNGDFVVNGCSKLRSIRGIKEINGILNIARCPSIKDLLLVFDIPGIRQIITTPPVISEILMRNLKLDNEFEAQNELIAAGFESMAEWD
jgi:hypothetical protein